MSLFLLRTPHYNNSNQHTMQSPQGSCFSCKVLTPWSLTLLSLQLTLLGSKQNKLHVFKPLRAWKGTKKENKYVKYNINNKINSRIYIFNWNSVKIPKGSPSYSCNICAPPIPDISPRGKMETKGIWVTDWELSKGCGEMSYLHDKRTSEGRDNIQDSDAKGTKLQVTVFS